MNNLLVQLSSFANTVWPDMRVGHSIPSALEDKLPCSNPDGPVDNSECPDDDPYCNCPCKELIPKEEVVFFDENEPSTLKYKILNPSGTILNQFDNPSDAQNWIQDNGTISPRIKEEDLDSIKTSTNECDLILLFLGEEWLGCDWSHPDSEISCVCPCVNKNYNDYIEYNRTYATYWDTPKHTPLYRNALMKSILSKRASLSVYGDMSLRPGSIIEIQEDISEYNTEMTGRKYNGKWLVSGISHLLMGLGNHTMQLDLIRDTNYVDPEEDYFDGIPVKTTL